MSKKGCHHLHLQTISIYEILLLKEQLAFSSSSKIRAVDFYARDLHCTKMMKRISKKVIHIGLVYQKTARKVINRSDVRVAPIICLEMQVINYSNQIK